MHVFGIRTQNTIIPSILNKLATPTCVVVGGSLRVSWNYSVVPVCLMCLREHSSELLQQLDEGRGSIDQLSTQLYANVTFEYERIFFCPGSIAMGIINIISTIIIH